MSFFLRTDIRLGLAIIFFFPAVAVLFSLSFVGKEHNSRLKRRKMMPSSVDHEIEEREKALKQPMNYWEIIIFIRQTVLFFCRLGEKKITKETRAADCGGFFFIFRFVSTINQIASSLLTLNELLLLYSFRRMGKAAAALLQTINDKRSRGFCFISFLLFCFYR